MGRTETVDDQAARGRAVVTQPARKRTFNGAIDSIWTLAYYSTSVLIGNPTVRACRFTRVEWPNRKRY